MIPLADFQPLSVAKTNIFSLTTGVLQKDNYVSDKVHAILIEEVLRDGTSLLEIGLKC